MKAFITKYALTQGIQEVEACEIHNSTTQMISINTAEYSQYFHGDGREWHRTRAGAVSRAENMRTAKIASLTKKIAALKALKFT